MPENFLIKEWIVKVIQQVIYFVFIVAKLLYMRRSFFPKRTNENVIRKCIRMLLTLLPHVSKHHIRSKDCLPYKITMTLSQSRQLISLKGNRFERYCSEKRTRKFYFQYTAQEFVFGALMKDLRIKLHHVIIKPVCSLELNDPNIKINAIAQHSRHFPHLMDKRKMVHTRPEERLHFIGYQKKSQPPIRTLVLATFHHFQIFQLPKHVDKYR